SLPKVKLLLVPCEPAINPSAPINTSTRYCAVSTLPDTTAAGYCGAITDAGGIRTVNGRKNPAFKGMGRATSTRKLYSTAAMTTDEGALKLPGCCGWSGR